MLQELRVNSGFFKFQSKLIAVLFSVFLSGAMFHGNDVAVGQAAPNAEPNAKEKKKNKDEILRGTVAYNKQEVDGFYKVFLIPALNSIEKPELVNAARREIYEDIERAEKASDSVLTEFNTMLLDEMKKLAEGNSQPYAAIIATQVLGRLNKNRPKGSSTAAEPLGAATGILFNLFRAGKNDGIRAAAISGLERHVDLMQSAWDDRLRHGIADAVLASLNAPKPPSRSPRSDAWLRGRSIELLVKVKHNKEAELFQYAIAALANPKTDILLVEKTLLVMGTYESPAIDAKLTNPALGNCLGYLVTRLKDWKKQLGEAAIPMGNSGSGVSDVDPMAGAKMDVTVTEFPMAGDGAIPKKGGQKPPKSPKTNPFEKQSAEVKSKRRALHELLENVRFGMNSSRMGVTPSELKKGLATLVPEGDNRQRMFELINLIKELQDTLNSPAVSDRTGLASETIPKIDALVDAAEILKAIFVPPIEGSATPEKVAPAASEVTVAPGS